MRSPFLWSFGLNIVLSTLLILAGVALDSRAKPTLPASPVSHTHIVQRIPPGCKTEAAALMTDLVRATAMRDDVSIGTLQQQAWEQVLRVYGEPVVVHD